MNAFKKVALLLVGLAVLGYLFVRSLQSTRAEPYEVRASQLTGWVVALDPPGAPTGAALSLRPPTPLSQALFKQVFARAMETLNAPATPGVPLLLQREFEQAFTGRVSAEQLLASAREAGLESARLEPVCLVHPRVSEPGRSRHLFAAVFRAPEFDRFRSEAGTLAQAAGAAPGVFEPAAIRPVLFIAASDPAFATWLPLAIDPDRDCVAPIVAVP